ELDRVRQQVLKDLLHQCRVALYKGKRANLPFQLAPFAFGFQVGQSFVYHRVQPGDLEVHFLTAYAAEIQQIIDQQPHAARALLDSLQVVLRLRRKAGTKFLGQELGEATDVAQGCAQIVRNRVGERFEFSVSRNQLRGT